MRTGGVNFKAEKSSKSWMSTAVSGEGLLQTFSGTGKVWLAPTQGVYEQLATNEEWQFSKPQQYGDKCRTIKNRNGCLFFTK